MTAHPPMKNSRVEASVTSYSTSNVTRVLSALVLGAGVLAGLRTSHLSMPRFQAPLVQTAAITPQTSAVPKKLSVMPDISRVFAQETAMTPAALMARWEPIIVAASREFHVSKDWIRAVMRRESGGRTMLDERFPITSDAGAMGLMQVMPQTYRDMRAAYRLGTDPYNPHDNIYAGAAYLAELHRKYGYPGMFAAYNDGPGNWEDHLYRGRSLPAETVAYVGKIASNGAMYAGGRVKLTQPDGAPVTIDLAMVRSVRAPLPGEYADSVQAVITVDKKHQGVRETVEEVRRLTLS